MGAEQRKHPRFDVRLAVRYTSAQEFVNDYVENLSIGGLFIGGATQLKLFDLTEVLIDLPGQGRWRVRAKAVFILDAEAAAKAGRRPGVGLEIIEKPPGFADAMLGYLLRLGRRREFAVLAGDFPGVRLLADAGYRVFPLPPEYALASALMDESAQIVAVVVPTSLLATYRDRARVAGVADMVFGVDSADEVADVIARIDSLL